MYYDTHTHTHTHTHVPKGEEGCGSKWVRWVAVLDSSKQEVIIISSINTAFAVCLYTRCTATAAVVEAEAQYSSSRSR